MSAAKINSPGDFYAKEWDRRFSKDRIPREKSSFVDAKRRANAVGDGVAIFLRDSEGAVPSCKWRDVEKFCQDSCLDDIERGLGIAGMRRAAWIDDRSLIPQANIIHNNNTENVDRTAVDDVTEPNGGTIRKCQNPLTATAVLRHLKEPRFDHTDLPDADRRLIYIPNLDPHYTLALAETAPFHQVRALRDAIWNHLALETSLRVKMAGFKGYPVFQMEMHIPFFAFREYPPSTTDKSEGEGCNRNLKRQWTDLSFLSVPASKSKPKPEPNYGIYKSRFSLVICGSENRRWIGYAFVDQHIDDEDLEEEDCSYEEFQEDPILSDGSDANLPIWDPREYFLMTLEIHVRKILGEWENAVYTVKGKINEYQSRHGSIWSHDPAAMEQNSTENVKEIFEWTLRTMRLLSRVLDVLSATVQAWERFKCHNGDIGYFRDSSTETSPFPRQTIQRSLCAIDGKFEELTFLQEKLVALKETCNNSAEALKLRLTVESSETMQHTGITTDFTVLVLYPFALATAFFAMPQAAIPFTLTFRSFVISVFVIMAMMLAFKLLFVALSRILRSWWRNANITPVKNLRQWLFWKRRETSPATPNSFTNQRTGEFGGDILEGVIETTTYAGGIEMHPIVV
ncbi:hypothetical protein BU16DRAFT_180672 [Lophium mytilinum]|uniref:Cora-domain-containing protein n=1 Tax=Lophium mytilinum TaxID=390894 RepID=A0A6A6QAI4_9PEZI|nr:hypothetical protein BU16DRAFT_180672 [Lophium mytilinum]